MPWDKPVEHNGEQTYEWQPNTGITPPWQQGDNDPTLLRMATETARASIRAETRFDEADTDSDMPAPNNEEIVSGDGQAYARRLKEGKSFSQRFADHAVRELDPEFVVDAPVRVAAQKRLDELKGETVDALTDDMMKDGLHLTPMKLPGEMREEYDLRQQYIDIANRFPNANGDQIMEVYSQEQLENQALAAEMAKGNAEAFATAFNHVVIERYGVEDEATMIRIAELTSEYTKSGVDPLIALIEAKDEVLNVL